MQLLALAASALALVSSVVAQPEAVRFGVVNVSPTTVKLSENFTIHYNSTFADLAGHSPIYLDFHIQGINANGFVQPEYLIARTTYPTNGTKNIWLTTAVPYNELVANASYLVWADIWYNQSYVKPGFLESGGTSAAINLIDDSESS